MTRRIVSLAAAALFLAAPASAEEVSGVDRFMLWNACKPMPLLVNPLRQDAADIGLAKDTIETTVRSRLRGARLYDAGGLAASVSMAAGRLGYLYVNVTVVRRAFSAHIGYHKVVSDPASEQIYTTETWSTGAVGVHGGDAGYVLSSVSRGADKFIDEYLRVNAESCGR